MSAEPFSLASTIILLFPMYYFLIASLTFFLAKFDDPTVTWMLRGLFNVYFLSVIGCCLLSGLAYLLAGRPLVVTSLAVLASMAVGARHWFLQRIDAQCHARDAGDTRAVRRLRRLHVGGMLYNATAVVAVMTSVPVLFGSTT